MMKDTKDIFYDSSLLSFLAALNQLIVYLPHYFIVVFQIQLI